MTEIQARLEKHPMFLINVATAFEEVFVEVDNLLVGHETIDAHLAGTTANVVLMRDKTLYISNAGDSRCVLAYKGSDGKMSSKNLSKDQNPNLPEEQARIEAAGGFVSPPPEPGLSARVWLDAECTQIGLAMGRSIGDHAVKGVGVIACPVVTEHEIKEEDEFIIIASDGVWEFIDSDEAVAIVCEYIGEGANRSCEALIEVAAERWREMEGDYRDDITAVIVQLKKVWEFYPDGQFLEQEGDEDHIEEMNTMLGELGEKTAA